MDKLIALIVMAAVFLGMAVIFLYLKMDNLRFRAGVLAGILQEAFTEWAGEASGLFEMYDGRQAACALKEKAETAKSVGEIIGAVNAYHALVKEVVAVGCADPAVTALGEALTERYLAFAEVREDYNSCVIRLNRLLNGKVTATPGRALGFVPLEKMNELAVL